ncbi:MAG: DUF177 domain-containing protein [Bergeyella sp.]|nr:DUF177 domain-containing protein [Bergeyella sp.]
MDSFRNYDVHFAGLKNGKHEFDFEITRAFFDLFEAEQEFENPECLSKVSLDKHSGFMNANIHSQGKVILNCDITGNSYVFSVENSLKILVKIGEKFDDSHEEIISLAPQDSSFNVAQLIYESIALAIPMKKIAPEISEKELKILEKYITNDPAADDKERTSHPDPRWEALKKLKN